MNNDFPIQFIRDHYKIFEYYNIIPSFITALATLITNYGTNTTVNKSNNVFFIKADNGWVSSKGRFIQINYAPNKVLRLKSYPSTIEAVIDFCEINKGWLSNRSYKELINYFSTRRNQMLNSRPSMEIVTPEAIIDIIVEQGLFKYDKKILDNISLNKKEGVAGQDDGKEKDSEI